MFFVFLWKYIIVGVLGLECFMSIVLILILFLVGRKWFFFRRLNR